LGRELILHSGPQNRCIALTREQLDIGDVTAVDAIFKEMKPDVLINAAAYTAVDKAETDRKSATSINALAPGILARACSAAGARLVHVSTDFVFSGEANTPYAPDSPAAPLGEYGKSKLGGELAVLEYSPDALIVRTGWVYSRFGNNFVKTMLRLMSERAELGVVVDQVGTPTWADGLAQAIWAGVEREQLSGTYHWSDAGVCSWYDFAVAIYEEASAIDLLTTSTTIRPIAAVEYPTPAARPAYSVLDKAQSWRDFELEPLHWRVQLRNMLSDLKEKADE